MTLGLDGVLYSHASPRRDDEILTRISPNERWEDALAGTAASLIVAGHTHQQDDRVLAGVRLVNAGSVGQPYEGDGAARWLWIEGGEPQLRCTEYDAASTGRRMLEAGWPDRESVAASLVGPLDRGVVTREFEAAARSSP